MCRNSSLCPLLKPSGLPSLLPQSEQDYALRTSKGGERRAVRKFQAKEEGAVLYTCILLGDSRTLFYLFPKYGLIFQLYTSQNWIWSIFSHMTKKENHNWKMFVLILKIIWLFLWPDTAIKLLHYFIVFFFLVGEKYFLFCHWGRIECLSDKHTSSGSCVSEWKFQNHKRESLANLQSGLQLWPLYLVIYTKSHLGASLAAQWRRIPCQRRGQGFDPLSGDDPTCHAANKRMRRSIEGALQSPGDAATETHALVPVLQPERPPQQVRAPQPDRLPLATTRGKLEQQQSPSTGRNT